MLGGNENNVKDSEPKEYNHFKSFIFASLSAVAFGIGNYLTAYVSFFGIKALYP